MTMFDGDLERGTYRFKWLMDSSARKEPVVVAMAERRFATQLPGRPAHRPQSWTL